MWLKVTFLDLCSMDPGESICQECFINQERKVEEAQKQPATIMVPVVKGVDLQVGRLHSLTDQLPGNQSLGVLRECDCKAETWRTF